jgi:hypothetical protein
MEVTGKIIQVLPEQGGVSKTSGKEWKLQSYVLETQEQYPKKVCFELFGEDRISQNPCAIDDMVKVSFDIESREYNGRWFTSIRAWRIEKVTGDNSQEVDLLADMPNALEMDSQLQKDNLNTQEESNLPF